jgi:Family of unknown function (DUF5317)
MIIPIATLVALLLPVALGGKPSRLAQVTLAHVGWVAGALVVQIVIVELLTGPERVLQAAHIATYLVAGWFVVANRRVPGLWLVALGALSNGLTIALNGGTLPARLGALQAAGLNPSSGRFVNSGPVAHPRLAFLGDVFAWPAPLPFHNVFSVGDVLIVLGIGVAAWRIMGTRWTRAWAADRTAPGLEPLPPERPAPA